MLGFTSYRKTILPTSSDFREGVKDVTLHFLLGKKIEMPNIEQDETLN